MKGIPNELEVRRMLLQADNQIGSDMNLLFYLFDLKKRATVSRNIALKFKKEPGAF